MINFPQVGTQEPIWSHDERTWQVCTPENVGNWSAVGYFFARHASDAGCSVGMINNAWGGSACEAWINREVLAADPQYKPLIDRWVGWKKSYADLKASAEAKSDELKKLQGPMGGNRDQATSITAC